MIPRGVLGHPLKGCCQRQKLPLCKKRGFFQALFTITDIVTIPVITCHLHERPSNLFDVQSIKELPGKLLQSGTESGADGTTVLELIYDDNSLKPGTIIIKGSDIFQGEYNR